MRARTILILGAALAASACNKKTDTAPPPPQKSAEPAAQPSPPPSSGLSDAQIAAIVVAANQVDIDAGQLAIERSTNPEVKKFAERMVTDHSAVNKAAVELVTKLHVDPVQSDASKGLSAGGAETRAKLAALQGAAFDKAYVDNEVAYHEAVIGVLKTQLIPSATNQELKDTLVGVQPAFDAHLQHAKQIQAALATGDGAVAHEHAK